MNLIRTKPNIDKQDLSVVRFGQGGCQTSRQRRCTTRIRKTGNTYKFGFMSKVMKFEVKTQPIANRFRVGPNEMLRIPGRDLVPTTTNTSRCSIAFRLRCPIGPGSVRNRHERHNAYEFFDFDCSPNRSGNE